MTILDSFPTDPASIFAILLLVGCAILVLRFGFQKHDKEGEGGNAPKKGEEDRGR